MEYTIDGGTIWKILGSLNGGVNWYNNAPISGYPTPEDGWTGDNTNWQTAEIDLPTGIEETANTQFRVVFVSDAGGFPSDLDAGVAFDNFIISGDRLSLPVNISVQGNGLEIINGDLSPYNLDGTNFRKVNLAKGTKSKTFTISNVGGDTLNLTGTTPVTISGSSAGDFTVTSQPGHSALMQNRSTTFFTVEFNPSATGTRNATISIANDDADESPFTFSIVGTGDNAIVFNDFDSLDGGLDGNHQYQWGLDSGRHRHPECGC